MAPLPSSCLHTSAFSIFIWKSVKANFSNKVPRSRKVTLVENNTIFNIGIKMNNFFTNIIKNSDLKLYKIHNLTDITDIITSSFSNQISVIFCRWSLQY